ncbi:unnamed protein product [Dracunculus medinensis]|uniref:KH domain-containing protein n=1 Tax=Dracunculus medinensis TaxID=318479 RepID=A0A158Q3X0_DRAME|nr:unnamed protein product [Dracunculus medinensis]
MENGHNNSSNCLISNSNSPNIQNDLTNSNHNHGRSVDKAHQYTFEYLAQLLKDKKHFEAFPNVFHHAERLIEEEISKVRVSLFQFEFAKDATLNLPEPEGEVVTMTEKIFVPVKEHPDYNFVGRILGPRGMTAKQLEQETGCKIMVRGKGSMRDKAKEEMNRGKPNWEHLSEDLHVLIQCEDTKNRATIKLKRTAAEVKKLLVPSSDDDELKRKQLMELAIINGTYRSGNITPSTAAQAAVVANKNSLAALQARLMPQLPLSASQTNNLRSPTLAGAPIILSPSRGATTAPTAATAAAAALAAQLQAVANQQQQNAAAAALSQQAANGPAAAAAAAVAGIPAHLLQPQALTQTDYSQLYLNSLQYDPTAGTYAIPVSATQTLQTQQQQYAAAAAAAMLGASYIGEYPAMELSNAGQLIVRQ